MFPFLRGVSSREPNALPLFPLKTVLFPGGLLPLKVFEQRYVAMTKACLRDDSAFGVCLLTRGDEVAGATAAKSGLAFAPIGTLARITAWDMPQLGILHLRTEGATRFQVQTHTIADDGLVVGQVTPLAPEPALALPDAFQSLANLLELLINRVGKESFPADLALTDASWVSYRLAEILPLPLPIKQSMLEINDSEVRLKVLAQFLKQQGLL
ncbi:MAG: LON peptidase substrate-binding domain-containing protein [Pseudomonadota bacterium]|nr:LON peptidase substrate-binding domain-containing protein [Pseudomonadota bacterium]